MNDAIATIAVVVLVIGNIWQAMQRSAMKRKLDSQRVIIDLYREKQGPLWGDMDVVLTDALPEELKL